MTKSASPTEARVGHVITYTITVHNRGPDTADHVIIDEASTGHASILSLKPSRGTCARVPFIKCFFGDLARGEKVILVVRVRARAVGLHMDMASVTALGPDPDPRTDHASADVRVRVRRIVVQPPPRVTG